MDRPGERVTGTQTGHGRTVLQHVVIAPAEGFVDEAAWLGSKTVGRVDSVRLDGSGQPAVEQRYYLSSREKSWRRRCAATGPLRTACIGVLG